MTEVLIRRATSSDVPAMADIVCRWEAETEWMPTLYGAEKIAGFIRDALPEREIWVAEEPATKAVQGYLSFDPAQGRIGGLYCARRGGGLGKALMDKVKEGRSALWLHTHAPNLRAQAFYRREGFVEVSRHTPEPPETVEEIRMEWAA
jgi:GNAT superfamily N-acetyltransferase